MDANVLIYSAIKSMPQHKTVRSFFQGRVLTGQLTCAVSFTVLLEFLHVTTDSKRFDFPLTMEESIEIVQNYWNASNWKRLLPAVTTGNRTLDLLQKHRLGRKRLLDAYLVAMLIDNHVNTLITCDRTDFGIFDELDLIDPLAE